MVKEIKAAKLADSIRDYLAVWSRSDLPGDFFSLTQITLSPDMRKATVWVDCFDTTKTNKILSNLNKHSAHYSHKLTRSVLRGKMLLEFKLDDRQSIENKLKELLK